MREYTGKLISVLYRKSQIFWSHYLKDHDITASEYPILIILNRVDGITQEDIATRLCVDKSGITRAMKSLEEKGFIERKKDQGDLRCNRIYLTSKGKDSWPYIKAGMDKWDSIISDNISENDIDEAIGIMLKMVDNIEKYTEDK